MRCAICSRASGTSSDRGRLLAFTTTVCLRRLCFWQVVRAAGVALAAAPRERPGQAAANAYSLTHFPLIAGVIYIALGIEQVLAHLSHEQPGTALTPLDRASIGALYGRAALSLDGGSKPLSMINK